MMGLEILVRMSFASRFKTLMNFHRFFRIMSNVIFTTDEGSTAETFSFSLNFTALNFTVCHVFISINAAQDTCTFLF